MAQRTKQPKDHKPPHYVGTCYDGDDDDHSIYKITEAIVTHATIMVTWKEGNSIGSMKVTSSNGREYSGKYQYKDDPSPKTTELERSDTKDGVVVLKGKWRDMNIENWSGYWTFNLTPSA